MLALGKFLMSSCECYERPTGSRAHTKKLPLRGKICAASENFVLNGDTNYAVGPSNVGDGGAVGAGGSAVGVAGVEVCNIGLFSADRTVSLIG